VIRPVHVRHIVDGDQSAAGATAVLGRYFVPQDTKGANGRNGFQSGQDNANLRQESDFTIVFPNADGGDRVRHLDRFLILATRADPGRDYKYGDEWLEVYEGDPPGGDLLRVGTPIDATVTRTTIELHCMDALKTLEHARETAGGLYWCAAPRDVIENYTQGWQAWLKDDFTDLSPFGGHYLEIEQTTNDGKWTFTRVEPAPSGSGLRLLSDGGGAFPRIKSHQQVSLGPGSTDPHAHYRFEVRLDATNIPDGNVINISIRKDTGPDVGSSPLLSVNADGTVFTAGVMSRLAYTGTGAVELAIEVRGRWAYYYFNGQLIACRATSRNGVVLNDVSFYVEGPTSAGAFVDIGHVIVRRTRPYLLRGADKGDYRLPGAPPPGGLVGSYFSEVATPGFEQLLSPLNKPYARRLDQFLSWDVPSSLPNQWQPPGTPNGEKFTARWTGSIYLDDPSTWRVRTRMSDRARVWIGKTRYGEQIIDDWPSGGNVGLNVTDSAPLTQLGTEAGWYPIIIEFSAETGPNGFIFEASKNGGPWVVPGLPGAPALSPLGIFEDQVRGESHATMVKQLMDTFGYQYRCDPMQLESGEFPGRVAPRVRVGADYDLELREDDDTDLQVQVTAEDAVDALTADAQGLADQSRGAQLTAEVINFPGLDQHVIIHEEAESLSEIANPELLLQRLNSLLALRSAPFEQVTATVLTEGGERKLVPIPLTGALAEIKWQPGDGVKRAYPILGVEDVGYVQMTTIARKFVPDALGLPAVSFRPRTRTFRDFLTRLQRQVIAPQRNYQGQLTTVQSAHAKAFSGSDADVWAPLPMNVDDVKRAELVVFDKVLAGDFLGDTEAGQPYINHVGPFIYLEEGAEVTGPGIPAGTTIRALFPSLGAILLSNNATTTVSGGSFQSEKLNTTPWGIHVNGEQVSQFTLPGRYDITAYIAPRSMGQPSVRASVVGDPGVSTGDVKFFLELQVLI
jgi:hypothetical protein